MTARWLREARRIVVVRPEELGDVILTVPMFPVLRSIAPAAELHLVCRAYTAPVARCVDDIDEVLTISDRRANDELEEHFRHRQHDVVFFPHIRSGHAWAAIRAGVRHRVGTWGRFYSVLYNHRVPRRSTVLAHETAYNLSMISHLVHEVFPPLLVAPRLPGHAVAELELKLAARGVDAASRLLVVHPGAGNPATPRWPPESFAAVAAQLTAEEGMRVVVTGSPSEAALVDRVVARCPGAVSLAGVLTVEELMVLLARAALVLSNSTGPTHLASVFDTPVVAVFAARDLLRWRLTNRRGSSIIPPDGTLALGAVSTDTVLADARRVLAIPAGRSAAGSVAVVGSDTGSAKQPTRPPAFPV